jgi:hypothetical protein
MLLLLRTLVVADRTTHDRVAISRLQVNKSKEFSLELGGPPIFE